MHGEFRAVFSYPPSYLGPTPDTYSAPVTDPADLPTHAPRSEETHGRVSGYQYRTVSEWEPLDKAPSSC